MFSTGKADRSAWRPSLGLIISAQILKDPFLLEALGNNVRLLLVNWMIQLPLALLLAYVLSRLRRGASLYRFVFYIPVILPAATMALLWRFIFSGNSYGLLNNLLAAVGLGTPDSPLVERKWDRPVVDNRSGCLGQHGFLYGHIPGCAGGHPG